MDDVDRDQWIKFMDLKIESMYFNSIQTLVDQSNHVKHIGRKWIYIRKQDQVGKVQTFKDRLVAKSYIPKEEVDDGENFSLVVMLMLIRILLSITTFYDYEFWQMDDKTTFLNDNHDKVSIWLNQKDLYNKVKNKRFVSLKNLFMD